MCLLTELGRTGQENIWPKVMVYGPGAARSVLHFINGLFTLYSEDEVLAKKLKSSTEKLCNMLFVFAFLAVNNLDVEKRQNPLKSHRTEQYMFLTGPYGFFWPSFTLM